MIVSGGAALQSRLTRIFNAAGITLIEGYGLTETSPVIAVNNITTNEIKIGTVGPPLNGVKLKFLMTGKYCAEDLMLCWDIIKMRINKSGD